MSPVVAFASAKMVSTHGNAVRPAGVADTIAVHLYCVVGIHGVQFALSLLCPTALLSSTYI